MKLKVVYNLSLTQFYHLFIKISTYTNKTSGIVLPELMSKLAGPNKGISLDIQH